MSHLSFFIISFIPILAFSQKKWDGGGGNNLWSNASNWTGNTVPSSTDDVVLDNTLVTASYAIVLPNTAVTVKTLTLSPSSTRTIDVTLPATNTAVPGFTANGPGYGMVINSGGTFKNSSGSTSGTTVRVTDSIKINNDGRYVHNTASGHATNVQVLSLASGTEKGIFEMDIPSASSTISISGRTFGRFVLRAAAAGGLCNYTAAGTSRVIIRNTLDIGAGVNLNLNCSDTMFIGADLIQDAGTFNLGNSTRSVVVAVQQNISQNAAGIITETGTGIQTILINGSGFQLITFRGTINNQVSIVRDGGGIGLLKSAISLPYKLTLRNGRLITTSGLITLQSGCIIEADSLSPNTYVDGPLKKDGLSNQAFLFPVGKAGSNRWVQLNNATGNFTVEYFSSDPHALSGSSGSGLDHFSSVEYWDVTGSSGAAATVKLSFAFPQSGGVTNLAGLRVARLINGTWEDTGNTGVSGSPGSDGWVSSTAASGFSATSRYFALASAMGQENPLPLSSVKLQSVTNNGKVFLYWLKQSDAAISSFDVEMSFDGKLFSRVASFGCYDSVSRYSCVMSERNADVYYRVIAKCEQQEQQFESNVVCIRQKGRSVISIAGSNIISGMLRLDVGNVNNTSLKFIVANTSGVVVERFVYADVHYPYVEVNVNKLNAGVYFLVEENTRTMIRFVKL